MAEKILALLVAFALGIGATWFAMGHFLSAALRHAPSIRQKLKDYIRRIEEEEGLLPRAFNPLPSGLVTLDCTGAILTMGDTVESTERPGHQATVGPINPDGTFDVCDIDVGLFERQRPSQWRKVEPAYYIARPL